MLDAVSKCRNAHGERVRKGKLTESDVISIRAMFMDGVSYECISKKFGIGITAVGDIRRGRTWQRVW